MVYEMWMRTRAGRTPPPPPRPVRPAVAVIAGFVLVALTVLTWWLWLGQDSTYQRDENGQWSGPYEAPQVIACVLTLAVLAGLGTLFLPPRLVVVVSSLSFTGAWSAFAAARDTTGLWAVGAIAVLLGTLAWATGAVAFAALARRVWAAYR